MQIFTLRLLDNGSYQSTEIATLKLATMTNTAINCLLIEKQIVIWSPELNVAYVHKDMLRQLCQRGIKTFTNNGQEFALEGVDDEKFAQLVKTVYALAKDILLNQHQNKTNDPKKQDVEIVTRKTKSVKGKATVTISASHALKQKYIRFERELINRLFQAIIVQIREQEKKRRDHAQEADQEFKRIVKQEVEKKCLEELIITNQILTAKRMTSTQCH